MKKLCIEVDHEAGNNITAKYIITGEDVSIYAKEVSEILKTSPLSDMLVLRYVMTPDELIVTYSKYDFIEQDVRYESSSIVYKEMIKSMKIYNIIEGDGK